MQPEAQEAFWLSHENECSLAELAAQSGLSEVELLELVDYGAIAPVEPRTAQHRFSSSCVVVVRTAYRLRRDFDLDPPALAFALSLLNRVRDLETELRQLQALLPRSTR